MCTTTTWTQSWEGPRGVGRGGVALLDTRAGRGQAPGRGGVALYKCTLTLDF